VSRVGNSGSDLEPLSFRRIEPTALREKSVIRHLAVVANQRRSCAASAVLYVTDYEILIQSDATGRTYHISQHNVWKLAYRQVTTFIAFFLSSTSCSGFQGSGGSSSPKVT
jgi:hypothetical protein